MKEQRLFWAKATSSGSVYLAMAKSGNGLLPMIALKPVLRAYRQCSRGYPTETGIHCNPHSFRRGFCVHQVKSGLSTRVVQSLGGWEQLTMVEHYSKPLTFDDALSIYHKVNGD